MQRRWHRRQIDRNVASLTPAARSPGQPHLSYRPARTHWLAESIPGLLKRLQIRAPYTKQGLRRIKKWNSYFSASEKNSNILNYLVGQVFLLNSWGGLFYFSIPDLRDSTPLRSRTLLEIQSNIEEAIDKQNAAVHCKIRYCCSHPRPGCH